jgi:ribonuclease VapC
VIVVDASAIVAILTGEPEGDALTEALGRASEITTSPVAVYEATLGLVRILRHSVADAETDVMEFLRLARVAVQPIEPEIVHVALTAFARYGKVKRTPGAAQPRGLFHLR